jgi:hypothetical protein
LIYDADTFFSIIDNTVFECVNVTIHDAWRLDDGNGGSAIINFINSLVADVGTGVSASYTLDHSYLTTGAIFQTAGLGKHYLLDDTYRNSGTPNIPGPLKNDLKKKTTYAPEMIPLMTGTLVLQAFRDNGEFFDLGGIIMIRWIIWLAISNSTLGRK